MHIESIKVFCDVARHRSFSQAATENHITQSAVSQAVSHLETRLGVQLIDRSTRPLHLTAPGKLYYDGCKNLIDQYLELEAAIRKADTELTATVRVAAIYSVGLGDMGQCVEQFEKSHPGSKVCMEYLHPDRVAERVTGGAADLGLLSFPRRSRELTVVPWREERMVLACPPDHPLARLTAVAPSHLNGEKYIGFDRGLSIRRHVDRFLKTHQVHVEVALEFDNIENIKKAVEVGAGVALLPEPTFAREVAAGTLTAVPLHGARLVRPLMIIHRRHPKPNVTARRFLGMLRDPGRCGACDADARAPDPARPAADSPGPEPGPGADRPAADSPAGTTTRAKSSTRGRRTTARVL